MYINNNNNNEISEFQRAKTFLIINICVRKNNIF